MTMTAAPARTGPAPAGTRERQRRDTRERVYEAAAAQIRSHGLAGSSVSAIAARAGVSRQTFYDHFPTLDAVVQEALRRYRERVAALLAERVTGIETPEDLLDTVVIAMFDALEPGRSRLRQEIAASLVRGPDTSGWPADPMVVLVAGALRDADARGEIAPTADPRDAAELLLTAVAGFLLIETAPVRARAGRARATARLLLRGLRP